MSNIKILIVEDNPSYALELEMLVDELGYEVLAIVDNAQAVFEILKKEKPDLILMDIQIKGDLDGIELSKKIEEKNINIIFVTSFNNKITFDKAKMTKHFGYIVKPFNHLTLEAAIEVALMNSENNEPIKTEWNGDLILEDSIFIKKRNRLVKVKIEEIIYIDVDGNYCLIFTEENKFILKLSLKKVINMLATKYFVRVNKSTILNMKNISSIDVSNNKIFLGDRNFVIGRTYKSDVMSKLKLLS